jgi:hypothetical protein
MELHATSAAQQLRELAEIVRYGAQWREAIAFGFELIAAAMEPCTDCGNCQGQDEDPQSLDVIHPDDNPETGV